MRSPSGAATGVVFEMADAYATVLRGQGLDRLDALFASSTGEMLSKPGLANWRQRWRLTLREGDRSIVLYMKRFMNPPRRATGELRRAGTGAQSLAANEWHWIHYLRGHGIPCVEAAAYGEEIRRGREVRSAILTAAVPGRSLESWVGEWMAGDRSAAPRLIPPTAELVAKLHACGCVHRDLYLSHIFYDPAQPVADCLRLIDLQRVLRPAWRMTRWRVKDLAALNYSTPAAILSGADRVRWLRYYLGVKKLGANGKALAYRVIGKTRWIARREARKKKI